MNTKALLAHISDQFVNDVTGHDIHHIERVLKLARYLQKYEGGDLELIECAAVLHDLDDHKFNGGILNAGGEAAKDLLIRLDYNDEFAVKVMSIVDQVSFKGALTTVDFDMELEAKIVQDADRLDALGAIGIARTFAYGGFKQQHIHLPELSPKLHSSFEEYVNSKTTSVNHFYEKLLLLKDKLNTDTARRIADDRHRFMEEFLSRFFEEWEVNLD